MSDIQLYHGDCLEVMKTLPDGCVDVVVTDPPYAKRYDYLYEILASESARLLRVGGSLVTLCGHYQLPHVLSTMSRYLKYRWIARWDHSSYARLSMGILVSWKPVLWFVNKKLSPRRCIVDQIPAGKRSKSSGHPWEQDITYPNWAIEYLTDEDDTVLDPLMGSGTTGVACVHSNRNFIGIEIEKKYFDLAKQRIEEAQRTC